MGAYLQPPVKFGLFAINYGACGDPETAVEVARFAESAGFESVWTGEHVVLPDPGSQFPPTLRFLDTTVALTLLAANTTSLKLASGIIVLSLRNPVLLAKELASIDVVSGGRLIVGVGAGYMTEEFDAVGVPLARRQERVDDYLRALRALWSMERPRHSGPFVSFDGIDAHPRPVQRGGPPVVIGGEGKAALVRAATMAEGWYGFDLEPDKASQCIETLRRLASADARPEALGPLEITLTPTGALDRGSVERYEALGVDRLVLLPQPDAQSEDKHRPVARDQILRNIEWAAQRLFPR